MRRFWSWVVGSSVVVALATFGIGSVGTATAGAAQGGTVRASSVDTTGAPYWPGWDIATGVALLHDGTGRGYVLDGFGGIHPFGSPTPPAMIPTKYVQGQVVAHNMALEGNDLKGAVINTHATPYPFGQSGQFPDQYGTCDKSYIYNVPTRGISLDPTPTGPTANPPNAYNVNGATIDAFGGIHPFCRPAMTETINVQGAPYWPNWKIVRGIALLPGGTGGFTLDGWGGVHPFGNATIDTPPNTYWGPSFGHKAWDIARSIAIDGHGNGVVLDGWGGLHPFTYGP
jgi:hypothetical protein